MKPSMAIWQERKQLKDELQLQQLRQQLCVDQTMNDDAGDECQDKCADLEGKGERERDGEIGRDCR